MVFHITDAAAAPRFLVEIAICQVMLCAPLKLQLTPQLTAHAPVRPQHVLRGVVRRYQRLHRCAADTTPATSCTASRTPVITCFSSGIVVGNIKNCWPGCNLRGMCSKADNFEINCTHKTAFSPVDKVRSRRLLPHPAPLPCTLQQNRFFVCVQLPPNPPSRARRSSSSAPSFSSTSCNAQPPHP
jgi:hypothetical protein